MNILLVNTFNSTGGAAIACKRLHYALLEQGYESKLLVLNKRHNTKSTYCFVETKTTLSKVLFQIKKHVGKLLYHRPYKYNSKYHYLHSAAPSVFDITKHELYEWADVINLHWVGSFLDFKSFFKHCQKPIVWTLHDMNPFTGGCHHAEECEGYRYACKKCPQLVEKYDNYNHKNWVKKNNSNLNHLTIVSPSTWLKETSLSSNLFKNLKHYTISNALDTTIFKVFNKSFCKDLLNLPSNKKVVLFVAQIVDFPLKGMQYLLKALDYVKDKVQLVVVGETMIDEAVLENTNYLGTIHDERLMALIYNAADVFIIPSLYENQPNVIIESLCCGTPVVAFNTGGIPELIEVDKNGYLAEKGNTVSLAKMIEKAINKDWNQEQISREAQSKFNYSKHANKYRQLFRELIAKS